MGRPPRGGRGLKSSLHHRRTGTVSSPPSRGAWIEILDMSRTQPWPPGRPPRGGRGLKSVSAWTLHISAGRRPPRGGRGLKWEGLTTPSMLAWSPPSRGAWIEIFPMMRAQIDRESPPSRGAWIEIASLANPPSPTVASPPSRGAWIEMSLTRRRSLPNSRCRPPRGGRGLKCSRINSIASMSIVAPLAGGVD